MLEFVLLELRGRADFEPPAVLRFGVSEELLL